MFPSSRLLVSSFMKVDVDIGAILIGGDGLFEMTKAEDTEMLRVRVCGCGWN